MDRLTPGTKINALYDGRGGDARLPFETTLRAAVANCKRYRCMASVFPRGGDRRVAYVTPRGEVHLLSLGRRTGYRVTVRRPKTSRHR